MPCTLAYYVDTYDAELPAAFETHMKQQAWVARKDVDKSSVELPRS